MEVGIGGGAEVREAATPVADMAAEADVAQGQADTAADMAVAAAVAAAMAAMAGRTRSSRRTCQLTCLRRSCCRSKPRC